MLSSRLGFFLSILTLLFVYLLYLPQIAIAQSGQSQLISLPIEGFVPNAFIVYGRAPTQEDAGITNDVHYRQTTEPLPNLKTFFEFGGTLELITTTLFLSKHDIVISEIMWGLDTGHLLDAHDTYTQWIELYNPLVGAHITTPLFFLFTPFENYPDRDSVTLPNGEQGRVLDAVSNLHLGKWNLPGRSGRRPFSSVISAYRDIVYPEEGNGGSDVPFGSYQESWKATSASGRRNTVLSIIDDKDRVIALPYIATPGTRHVQDAFLRSLPRTIVRSDRVVINEVRNDVSDYNLDWVELKNVSRLPINLADWELSIVTGVNVDIDLVDLPDYEIAPGEVLLIQARHPKFTVLADGINIASAVAPKNTGAIHKYFVDPNLELPNIGKFVLLLRSESDKNGQDAAIEDYAGNGFFPDTAPEFNTEFWPRKGQQRPTDVASFGNYTSFGSLGSSWARLRYQRDDGHHKDAWEVVGSQGGIGYAPRADLSTSPGTPGYENTVLKTHADDANPRTPLADNEYTTGMISISEIMSDPGVRRNKTQWIELYNSSLTEAVNLAGWILEIRNLQDDVSSFVNGRLIFNDAVILSNQTLLLVSDSAPNNVPENRIYNLYDQHRHQLRQTNRRVLLLNPSGFYVKLTDKGVSGPTTDDIVVDQVGNLSVGTREPTRLWELPLIDVSARLSLVRQYGVPFRSGQRDSVPGVAVAGRLPEAWLQADRASISSVYYGDTSDRGTPGHRLGSPLPVELSSFRPKRTEIGTVTISWSTESELNNAGFNILRSETRDGVFQIINPTLIPGAGTTSERQRYDFTDTTAKQNVVYYYQIEDVSLDGVRQTLVTARLKGQVSASDKLTTTWGNLKTQH